MAHLTPEQIAFFRTFGYLHVPGLFRQEASAIQQAFDEVMQAHRDEAIDHVHEAHYQYNRIILNHFVERHDTLRALLSDPRITDIAEDLAGEDYNYLSSDGNVFSGNTIWHRDSYGLVRKQKYTKFLFYLDDIKADSGALRLIPGSHHQGQPFSKVLHDALKDPAQQFGLDPDEVPCQIIQNAPGDVIIFDYNIQHATCHAQFPRRMFSIGITEHFPEPKRQMAIDAIKMMMGDFGGLYSDTIRNSQDPAIRDHIRQMLELETEARKQPGQA